MLSPCRSARLARTRRLGLLMAVAGPMGAIAANAAPDVRIHEIVAVNQSGLQDGLGARPDWVELHNASDSPVNLAGWSLSDDPRRPNRWTFRSGSLPPRGYLLVFASGEDRQPAPVESRDIDEIPGLLAWHRADTFRADRADLLRVSGGQRFVRAWPDSRLPAHVFRQDLAARQPRWIDTPAPAVRFDGVDDLLLLSRPDATNRFTVLVVARPTTAHENDGESVAGVEGTRGQRWLLGATHGGDFDAGVGLSFGTNGAGVYEHGSGHMPARVVRTGSFSGTPSILLFSYDGSRPALSVNGLTGSRGASSNRRSYFSPVELGSGAYGAFQGDVLEIAVFDRALDPAEEQAVSRAVATRHDISLAEEWHTNFRLDGSGETLLLTSPVGEVVEQVRYPALPADIAWGRRPEAPESWGFFETPTPGTANTTRAASRFLTAPTFSQPPGFHPQPIRLALMPTSAGETSELRFTLDGSQPTDQSQLYVAPIEISDRTTSPNRLSTIPTGGGWQAPLRPVFKGTVVRARAFAPDSIPSPTITGTYFVHPAGRARYSLPVVSLTVARADFFDAQRGIYVPGNAPGGNFAQSGDEWERAAYLELFETNGVRALAASTGVRIHGNTSFQFPVKALRLHALNQGGTGPFRHRIFPEADVDQFNRLLLRPSGHDYNLTLMRDGLMQSLGADLGLDTQRYRPAILFINAEYWGIHNLQEAFEKGYFPAHHPDVDAEAVDYLEGYAPSPFVYEGSADAYLQIIRYLEENGASTAHALSWLDERMDLANFRDYKIAEIFHYRWDIGNHRFWRPNSPAGRFRWILFDCDVGFGGFWSESNPWAFNMLRAVLEPSGSLHGHNQETTVFLLRSLLVNADFRNNFVLRFADVLNSAFESERVVQRIDRMAAEIAPQILEHTERWRQPVSMSEWRNQVERLREFARRRPASVRSHLASQFGLNGWTTLEIAAETPGAGSVNIHSLSGLARSNSWIGWYPLRTPLQVHALPSAKHVFAGWRELPGVATPDLTVSLQANTKLTPVFHETIAPRLTFAADPASHRFVITASQVTALQVEVETSADLRRWNPGPSLTPDAHHTVRWSVDPSESRQFFRLRHIP